MKHRDHMILGGIAILVAVMLFGRRGVGPLAAGFGFALLLCPIVMGTVMWLLMRQPKGQTTPTERTQADIEEHASTGSRP